MNRRTDTYSKRHDTARTYEELTDMRELRRRLRELTDREAHKCKPCETCKTRQERKDRTRGMIKTLGKWVVGVSFRLGYPLALVYAVVEGHIPMLT